MTGVPRSYIGTDRQFHTTKGGPGMLRSCMGDTIEELWVEFAHHAKELWSSIAPVLFEEAAEVADRLSVQCDKRPSEEPYSEKYSCYVADKYRYAAAELRDASLLIRELEQRLSPKEPTK